MIFLAAGTQDGRQIAGQLLECGYKVTASVVSEYGKILLSQHENLTVIEQMLDEQALEKKLKESAAKIFIDASHPYAVNISQTAMKICAELGIHYIRYERPGIDLPEYDKLYTADSFEMAAKTAFKLGKNVFLTTGSRHLTEFTSKINNDSQILTVRVLPVIESLEVCLKAGILPKHIIAMQGPFSKELNEAVYKEIGAEVIVMKNSGRLGGSDTKLTAAIELGLFVVVIDRPGIKYKNVVTDSNILMAELKNIIFKEK